MENKDKLRVSYFDAFLSVSITILYQSLALIVILLSIYFFNGVFVFIFRSKESSAVRVPLKRGCKRPLKVYQKKEKVRIVIVVHNYLVVSDINIRPVVCFISQVGKKMTN